MVSELEASLLLYFTGYSRTSADIIEEQSRNVRDKNPLALEAMHSIKEEAFRMKECVLRGDFHRMHEVLLSSWESKKRMASQITNEHVESLYACALDAGAHCARISGAGGGGFMVFLTDPIHKDTVAAALRANHEGGRAYGCHFTADDISDLIRKTLAEGLTVLQAVAADSALHAALKEAAERTASALKSGHKLMVAGNGGSAADAQHLVAEFVSRLCEDRPAMRAVALTTDSSILTAIGNDYGYECVFARQIEALGQAGDVFMGISTSGNSPNVLRALELSRGLLITTIGLSGRTGGDMFPHCDYCIRIPSDVTMYIQQAHLALEHIFCMMVEQSYFGRSQLDPTDAAAVPEE